MHLTSILSGIDNGGTHPDKDIVRWVFKLQCVSVVMVLSDPRFITDLFVTLTVQMHVYTNPLK